MKNKRLVLFDIDGTLLNGGRLWRECFEASVAECFPGVIFPRVSFSGKTDRLICMELMKGAGIWTDDGVAQTWIDDILKNYLGRVRSLISQRSGEVTLLPGVRKLVDSLRSHADVCLGLLTGNVEEGAQIKLQAVGMGLGSSGEFAFGAFGNDHWNRYELPAIAVRRALEKFSFEFQAKQIVIIGDTVHDVNCGKSLGVRTIAVGTGHSAQRTELLGANPDYFFSDLSAHEQVLASILCEM
ncbi:MAG: HAD family hydrolase [Methylotenera sp.]|nr:HAD family hydrolase [Oligoflexia bacterium]